ncbi:MAG: MFS transporter, partial [Alphaproteobacteria bacterium]|nr:MFS transporter [Alphaproteobacteria bacterium]
MAFLAALGVSLTCICNPAGVCFITLFNHEWRHFYRCTRTVLGVYSKAGRNINVTANNNPKRSIFAWCLFDWGNSAFGTVIITFVFSVYFARGVVGDETMGAAWWGYAMAASGLLIALLSPALGAVADHYGARKPGLLLFTLLCVVPTALLYFAAPGAGTGMILAVLALVVMANVGFGISLVYANAMLPHIAPPAMIGRISGWAWGLGYAG